MDLAQQWNQDPGKCTMETISLRPTYEVQEILDDLKKRYPKVSRNRMINDALKSALYNLWRSGE